MHTIIRATLVAFLLALSVSNGCSESRKPLSSVDDLQDKRIGVLLGSTHDRYATRHFPKATILQYKAPPDVALAVKSGKVDAAFYARETLPEVLRAEPELGVISDSLEDIPVGVGFSKNNQQLRQRFNSFLAQLRQSGIYADMVERWLKKSDTRMPDIDATGANGTLTVGNASDKGLPFTIVKDGRLIGFDNELVERFAAFLGKKIVYADMEFGSLIAAVATNKVDMAVSTIMITEERKKQIDFSDPYYELGTSVFALKKNIAPPPLGATDSVQQSSASDKNAVRPGKLSSLDDLKDKRIGVLLGSTHDAFATRTYPNATVSRYKSPLDIILAVKTGKVDAAIYSYDELLQFFRVDNDMDTLGPAISSAPVGMGFHMENTELLAAFNSFLKQCKESGLNDDMIRRWMKNGDTVMPEIASNPSENGVIVVGLVGDNGLPFAVVKDGKLIGYSIELLERFAAHAGKKIVFMDMEFGSLIAAAATKKIDMIGAVMAITEERKRQIAFSDPYYQADSYAFALKKNIAGHTSISNPAASPLPYIENDISVLVRQSDPALDGTRERERNEAAHTPEGPGRLARFLIGVADSFHSNIILEKRYLLLWEGLKTTVLISIFATIFGTLLGGLVCSMRMSRKIAVNLPARVYIALLRGTPVLVLLMLIFYVVFASVQISPVLVAVIAFGMNFAAYVAEILRSGIEGIHRGQTEAGIAMGFTRVSTFLHIILPQTVQRILPVYKGEFISLVKMTSIVGYIAVQDLTKASDIIRSRTFDAFFPLIMVAVLYFGISWLLMQSLDYLERRTDPKLKRKRRATA